MTLLASPFLFLLALSSGQMLRMEQHEVQKELVNMKHTFIILQLKNFPFSEEQSWPRTASTTPQNCFKFDKSKIAYLYVWVRADCQDRQSHEPVGAPHSEVIMSCGQIICGTFDGDGKLPCPCLISRTPLLMSY